MAQESDVFDSRLRLLECWLPLAEWVCRVQGWQENTRALEALIVAAAPALQQARSAEEAYQIMCAFHQQLERD